MSNILRRGRLEDAQEDKILRYTSSMEADRWLFNSDIVVDLAHTVMLKEQCIINKEDCSKILSGLLRIREEGMEKLDFSYEDLHISLESRLIDIVGEEMGAGCTQDVEWRSSNRHGQYGNSVLAAMTPARCAAPPAPAISTRMPRSRAVSTYSKS